MLKNICFFCLLVSGGWLHAQITLDRQVISSTGQLATVGNITVSSSVGETVVETVMSGSLTLTQGFQQPESSEATSIQFGEAIKLDYTIAPNPTRDEIRVRISAPRPVVLRIRLLDMRGRELSIAESTLRVEGTASKTIDLSSLAEGIYQLVLIQDTGEILKAFRVQKVH